jgi:ABC-type transporter Mla subunit MlaD
MIVGGFVIVAFCAFVYMLALFGELPVAVSKLQSYEVLVDFPQAPGVLENTRVNYCGYQIGRVTRVWPPERVEDYEKGKNYHRVRVKLAIDREYQNIPASVDVLLMKRGLGSSYIELSADPDKKITGFLQEGDLLKGKMGTSTEFIPQEVQDKIEDLVDSVSELSKHANDIIGNEENKKNINLSLNNIKNMTGQAVETLESVKKFADKGSVRVDETAEELNAALRDLRVVLAKIDEGEGTAGRFVNDGRLYENLLDSSRELELALEQLKLLAAQAREDGLKIKW